MQSFRTKLLVMMAALLGACVAFVQLYFPSHFRAESEAGLADRAKAVAHLTAASLRPALDFDDGDAAARRLSELGAVPEAEAAVAYGPDGAVLGRWSRADAPVAITTGEGFTDDRFITRVAIDGREVRGGSLVVAFGTKSLARRIAESKHIVGVASLGVLGVGLLLALIMGTTLVRPIARVTEMARRISAGDVNAKTAIDLGRSDELGVMARALDDMVARLVHERALLESQLECSSEGILVAGTRGELLVYNTQFREMWKLDAAALSQLKLPELLQLLRAQSDADLPLLQRHDDFTAGRLEPFKLRDGRVLTAYRAPIFEENGAPFALAWYFRDVTELRSAQEQLVLADRRSSVGRLAAGVAHEVNNPLTFIIGNVSYCIDQLQELTEPKEAIETMIESLRDAKVGAERVAYIVRSLTALSRGDEGERECVDLVDCLEKTLAIASPELKHRASVERRFPAQRVYVDASSVRLGQVFLNLLINAAKAMPSGKSGHIIVDVRPRGDRSVEISITDDGCGMSEEVKQRLFTPFFTTREVGAGTGLGLSISQSIVRSYGGDVTVDSELGRGSTFTVRLPVSKDEADEATEADDAQEKPSRRLRLLVVDDELQVCRTVRRSLDGQHEVVAFQKPEEAIASLQSGARFDLLLSDLHMPGMTGAQLHDAVGRLDPRLAANTLFMSGGAVTEDVQSFARANEDRLLPKPLDARRLRRALAAFSRRGTLDAA